MLELSRIYESVTVPPACPKVWPAIVALVARQRRHMQAVLNLGDAGLYLEAEIVVRTMFEFFIRQKWLHSDPELHRLLWFHDDIQRRFTIDRTVRRSTANDATPTEILRPDVRESLERTRDEIEKKLAEIAAERALDRIPTYPQLEAQAIQVGEELAYNLAYRMDSQSAAHPSTLGLENLARLLPDGGIEVLAEPEPENRLDVYGTGAVYLREALLMAGEEIPQLRVDGLENLAERLRARTDDGQVSETDR